jgi:hypothetical protein
MVSNSSSVSDNINQSSISLGDRSAQVSNKFRGSSGSSEGNTSSGINNRSSSDPRSRRGGRSAFSSTFSRRRVRGASGRSRASIITSQKVKRLVEAFTVGLFGLADNQVSDDKDSSLSEDSVFRLAVGNAKSFSGDNSFEFTVLVKVDLVVEIVREDLSQSSSLSVIAVKLLVSIVVGERTVQEGKVTKSNNESRRDNGFSISTIIYQSVLGLQSMSWLDNSVKRNTIDNEGDSVVVSIVPDTNSVKVALRVAFFTSDQRNSVEESSIFKAVVASITAEFVVDLGIARENRGFTVTRSARRKRSRVTRIIQHSEVFLLQSLPAVENNPVAVIFIGHGVLDRSNQVSSHSLFVSRVSLGKFNKGNPVVQSGLVSLGVILPVIELFP